MAAPRSDYETADSERSHTSQPLPSHPRVPPREVGKRLKYIYIAYTIYIKTYMCMYVFGKLVCDTYVVVLLMTGKENKKR